MPLLHRYASDGLIECGCDEAGRGALAGDLYAAAVVWPETLDHPHLRDSKKLTARQREELRHFIEEHAIAWAVGVATVQEIQQINILHASMLAMQRAIEALPCTPERLLIDGNYYDPRPDEVEYHTIVKGDDRYLAIAAASILAKRHSTTRTTTGSKTKGTRQRSTVRGSASTAPAHCTDRASSSCSPSSYLTLRDKFRTLDAHYKEDRHYD